MSQGFNSSELDVSGVILFLASSALYIKLQWHLQYSYSHDKKPKRGSSTNGNGANGTNGTHRKTRSSSSTISTRNDVMYENNLIEYQRHQDALRREHRRLSFSDVNTYSYFSSSPLQNWAVNESSITPPRRNSTSRSSSRSTSISNRNYTSDPPTRNIEKKTSETLVMTSRDRFDHHFDLDQDFLPTDHYDGIRMSLLPGEGQGRGRAAAAAAEIAIATERERAITEISVGAGRGGENMRSFEDFDDIKFDSIKQSVSKISSRSCMDDNTNLLESKARKPNKIISDLEKMGRSFNSEEMCDDEDENEDEEEEEEEDEADSDTNNLNDTSHSSAETYLDFHLGPCEEDVFNEHTDTILGGRKETINHHDGDNNNNNSNINKREELSTAMLYRKERAKYNSRIMPRRLIMIRHGQSEGNVNEALYTSCPDSNIRLTKLGWDQAKMAGKALREQIFKKNCNSKNKNNSNNPTVHFIVSPYVRTMETFHGLASAWCDPKEFENIKDDKKRLKLWYGKLASMGVTFNEDPRIREQDFGNYQNKEAMKESKSERHKFGPFYYRFPNGESASDVFDRISTFLDSLWRSFSSNKSQNYVLVTHGISIRVILARYFRYTVDQFNMMANPSNCDMVILGHDGYGRLELEGRCELKITNTGDTDGENTNDIKVSGYKFYRKLKVVPKRHMRTRNIRMAYS